MDAYSHVNLAALAQAHFSVRPMQGADLPALETMVSEIDHGVWTAREFSTSLAFGHLCLVLIKTEAPEQPLGYLVMSAVQDEAELLMLGIDADHQGRGLGRLLLESGLEALSESIDSVFLEVRASNAGAQALYQKVGFFEVGLRRRYYRPRNGAPGEDAILMRLSLG
jgi:ribosomal-protein-alanine N-acetyltransferase